MWRGETMCSTLAELPTRYRSGRRKNIEIVVDNEVVASTDAFESWYDTVHLEKNDGVAVPKVAKNRGKFLFVHYVLSQGPLGRTFTATRDEKQEPWGSTIQYTVDGELYYNDDRMTITNSQGASPSATPPAMGALGDDSVVFNGHEFVMVMPACSFTYNGMQNNLDPMYICRRCQILPEQAWDIPTLLVTANTWKQIGPRRPHMTHHGAFGGEYKSNVGVLHGHDMVLCWKFPGDMFDWGTWMGARLNFPLPVGRYNMTDDKWGSVSVTSLPEMPMGQPMIKMRMGGVHYLQARAGGDETKVVMLGFQYFVNDMWVDDEEGATATGQMLDRLHREMGITGFSNHSEHHAIVMYSYEGSILTPRRWQALLQSDKFPMLRNILLSGSSAKGGLSACLQRWKTANLEAAPFLA